MLYFGGTSFGRDPVTCVVSLLTLNLLTVPQVLTPDPYPKVKNAICKVVAEFVEPTGFQQLKKSTCYFRDRLLRRLDDDGHDVR